ncbi:MAG: TatD family hydrolase [Candidatus Heimdallarchaeaceae archaeon]
MFKTGSALKSRDGIETVYADAHSHLVPEWFTLEDVATISKKSWEAGVKVIINSAIEPEHYQFGLETIKNEGLYLTAGVDTPKINEERVSHLKKFFIENIENIVAIGEIGLDFYWIKENSQRKIQEEYFKELVTFAIEHDTPIVIHSRDAEGKAIEILKSLGAEDVLMHCFGGTKDHVYEIMNMSWYISVPTSAVYRKNFQKILKSVSLDNLMFETDSPFHSLEKGENNNPTSIPILCRHAAKMLSLDAKELAYITTKNVKDFYRL